MEIKFIIVCFLQKVNVKYVLLAFTANLLKFIIGAVTIVANYNRQANNVFNMFDIPICTYDSDKTRRCILKAIN